MCGSYYRGDALLIPQQSDRHYKDHTRHVVSCLLWQSPHIDSDHVTKKTGPHSPNHTTTLFLDITRTSWTLKLYNIIALCALFEFSVCHYIWGPLVVILHQVHSSAVSSHESTTRGPCILNYLYVAHWVLNQACCTMTLPPITKDPSVHVISTLQEPQPSESDLPLGFLEPEGMYAP